MHLIYSGKTNDENSSPTTKTIFVLQRWLPEYDRWPDSLAYHSDKIIYYVYHIENLFLP